MPPGIARRARGWCTGRACRSSSRPCSTSPSRCVSRCTSARGATTYGSPTATETGRPRRRSQRRCAVAIRCGPHSATGTTGAPVSAASAASPGHQRPDGVGRAHAGLGEDARPPRPRRSRDRARRYAAAGAAGSTGTCRIAAIARPTSGADQMSCRARKRTLRRLRRAARPTSMKSRKLTWLAREQHRTGRRHVLVSLDGPAAAPAPRNTSAGGADRRRVGRPPHPDVRTRRVRLGRARLPATRLDLDAEGPALAARGRALPCSIWFLATRSDLRSALVGAEVEVVERHGLASGCCRSRSRSRRSR